MLMPIVLSKKYLITAHKKTLITKLRRKYHMGHLAKDGWNAKMNLKER